MADLEKLRIVVTADTKELKEALGEISKEISKSEPKGQKVSEKAQGKTDDFSSPLGPNSTPEDGSILRALLEKIFERGTSLTELEKEFIKNIDGIRSILEDKLDEFIKQREKELRDRGVDGSELKKTLEVLREEGKSRINEVVDDMQTEVGKAVEQLSQKVSDAFVEMALKGEFSIKKIGDIFLKTFLDLVAKKLIQEPLEELLGNITKIFGFAGGGEVEAGVPIRINEQGQEIFIPHTPGRIANADEARQIMGTRSGVVVNQSLHFDTAIRNDMIATIMQASPLLVEQTRRAVLESVQGRRY